MFGRGDLAVQTAERLTPGGRGDQPAGVAAGAQGRQEAFAREVAFEQHREGQLPAGGVGAERLARFGVVLQQVDEVVVDLVGDAEVAAEEGAGVDVFGRAPGEQGADAAGAFEEFGGLQADVPVVVFQ